MTAETVSSGAYRLTLPRLAGAQVRAFLGGGATTWGTIAVVVVAAVSGLIAGVAGLPAGQQVDPLPSVNAAVGFAAVGLHLFALAVGADAIAGEFARGTVGAWFSVVPRRGLLFASKALAACAIVVAVGFLTGIVAGGSTLFVAAMLGHPVGGLTVVAWLVSTGGLAVGAGVLALLTLSIGTLTRQRTVAVLVPIAAQYLLPLFIGVLLSGATRDWAYAMLPSTAMTALATTQALGGVITVGMTVAGAVELPLWGALLVLTGWCALLVPAAAIMFLRRDLSTVSTARARMPKRVTAPHPSQPGSYRATAMGLLRSEFRKSWSLPSVRWILTISTLLMLGSGASRAATGSVEGVGSTPAESLSIEFGYAITGGVGGVALLLAVLMAIQIAGEFETGTAVSTFVAAPRRWHVTRSKLITATLSGLAIALPGLIFTALTAAAIYAGRGYPLTGDVLGAGALVTAKALLFLVLMALTSAGVAGFSRRSVTTIITVAVLLIIGPALLNTVRGFASEMGSPLAVIGNAARLLPWEGARFFYPTNGATTFAQIDSQGILHVSAEFGIAMTALWALLALIVWFAADARRPITIR